MRHSLSQAGSIRPVEFARNVENTHRLYDSYAAGQATTLHLATLPGQKGSKFNHLCVSGRPAKRGKSTPEVWSRYSEGTCGTVDRREGVPKTVYAPPSVRSGTGMLQEWLGLQCRPTGCTGRFSPPGRQAAIGTELPATGAERVSASCSRSERADTPSTVRYRRRPGARSHHNEGPQLGLKRRSCWRVRDHPRMAKVGRDEPSLSVGRGENHTRLRKRGYFRIGSSADIQTVTRDRPLYNANQPSARRLPAGIYLPEMQW